MVGRSNVGKSSLINALARKPLARTSAAPGKTRLANYYRLQRDGEAPFFLVDLPGFGYARGGRTGCGRVRSRSPRRISDVKTAKAVSPVRGAFLLVDSRHPGLASDGQAWAWLEGQGVAHAVAGDEARQTDAGRTPASHQRRSKGTIKARFCRFRWSPGKDWTNCGN